MKISNYLVDTDPRHSDMIDAFAYAFASQEFKLREEYMLLYIKKKPKWIPKFLYDFLISKIVVVANLSKSN